MINKDNYNINIYKRRIELTEELGHVASISNTRNKFNDVFKNDHLCNFPEYSKYKSYKINRHIINSSIERYSEQLIANPLNDLSYWHKFRSGRFILPGYPNLYYIKGTGKISANKTAVAAIGEGLAGLITQWIYKCFPLARPNHDFPDIVMKNNKYICLVEAKAITDKSKIISVLNDNLKELVSYTYNCDCFDENDVVGLLYGTSIIDEYNFDVYINEIAKPSIPMIAPSYDYISSNKRKIINLDNELLFNLNLLGKNKGLANYLLDEFQKAQLTKLKLKNKLSNIDGDLIKEEIYKPDRISEDIKKSYETVIDMQLKDKSGVLEFIDKNTDNIMNPDNDYEIRTVNNQEYELNSFSTEPDKINYIISPLEVNEKFVNEDLVEKSKREWFPYDVIKGDNIYLIDQDGSIRIFAHKNLEDKNETINNIINSVY